MSDTTVIVPDEYSALQDLEALRDYLREHGNALIDAVLDTEEQAVEDLLPVSAGVLFDKIDEEQYKLDVYNMFVEKWATAEAAYYDKLRPATIVSAAIGDNEHFAELLAAIAMCEFTKNSIVTRATKKAMHLISIRVYNGETREEILQDLNPELLPEPDQVNEDDSEIDDILWS